MQNQRHYMGFEYVWWQGVVEDRMDPLKIGRCRVRILGFHTEDKNEIPTDSLPWAYSAMPVNATPESTPTGPKEGTWVMGFFRDGKNAQEPVMTHQIDYGYVNQNQPSVGFNDPEENTNKPSKPAGVESPSVGEVNTNTLGLGDNKGTLSANRTQYTDIETASGGTWSEPDNPYVASYPYNRVIETESGHVIELDDTPGGERISETHRSGTFREIHPSGDKVVQIVGNDYELVIKNKNIYIKGNLNVNIEGNSTEQVTGNKVMKNSITDLEATSQVKVKSGTVSVDSPTINLKGNVNIDGVLTVGKTVITSGNVVVGASMLSTAGLLTPTISAGAGGGAGGSLVGEPEGLGNAFLTVEDLKRFQWTIPTGAILVAGTGFAGANTNPVRPTVSVDIFSNPASYEVKSVTGAPIGIKLEKRVQESSDQQSKMKFNKAANDIKNAPTKLLTGFQVAYTTALDALTEIENTIETLEDDVNQYVTLENSLQSQLNTLKGTYGIS